jgi:hypothetical protein
LWTAPSGIILSSRTVAMPTFTAPEVTANTNYNFSLVVNDGKVNSIVDQVNISVSNIDHAPYVKIVIEDISVEKSAPDLNINLSAIFADDDKGDLLTYSIVSNENENIVHPEIRGSNLILSFSTENTGFSQIEVKAVSNGKEATSKFMVEVTSPTSANLLLDDAEVKLYPNPTKDIVNLKFDRQPNPGTLIMVYNESGAKISEQKIENMEQSISLKGNPPGLYVIKINHELIKYFKVILQ